MQIIALLLGIAKAVPIIDSWIQQLATAYATQRIADMQKENLDAIRKAIQDKDQRDLEAALGNPHPGEASGDPGAVITDAPPPNVVVKS
jgi:hypothetical protein